MSKLLIFAMLFSLTGFFPVPREGKWLIDSSSQLIIRGSTNVNKFTCETNCYNSRDTLVYALDARTCKLIFEQNKMIIPVDQFNCGNNLITKDFRETLQSEQHPNLSVEFISFADFNTIQSGKVTPGNVEITLAGKTRSYHVDFLMSETQDNALTLTGNEKVCFSDFELEAPRKMMGMIRVDEYLEVEFRLQLLPM